MQTPDVVVVGSATRDLNDDDPRGWLMGGGVTFGALTLARLGLRTGVLLGLDAEVAGAQEIDLLRDAGAQVAVVPLAQGPIFRNIERLDGRIQICDAASDPIPISAVPEPWAAAPAWLIAPVALEISDAWAKVPPPDGCVALGWQGMLRDITPGAQVRKLAPTPTPLVRRADIVSLSRHDVPDDLEIREIGRWLAPRANLLLTAGLLGGMSVHFEGGQLTAARAYPSVPSLAEIDATGAGDTMLAGHFAARIALGDQALVSGRDVQVGATAASLLVEGPGMDSVPSLGQLRERLGR